MTSLRVIISERLDCFEQMALDEALFLTARESQSSKPIIRFYQFQDSCATVGFSQRNPTLLESIDANSLPWARRPTGGGVVFHNRDLIYSLVLPSALHPDFHCAPETYRLIHEAVHATFRNFWISPDFFSQDEKQKLPDELVCFEHPVKNDVLWHGEKIAGGAERRSNGFLLHQGSVKLSGIDKRDFQSRLVHELKAKFNWASELSRLDEAEEEVAKALEESKYRTQEWNWKGKTSFQKDYGTEAHVVVSK